MILRQVGRIGAAIAALVFLAIACSGGSSTSTTGVVTPAGALRTDLLFGYFANDSTTVLEAVGHANLAWVPDAGALEQLAILTHAKGGGISNVILAVPGYGPNAEGEVRHRLDQLRVAGLLENIRALYPIDEPDTPRQGNRADAEVVATNAMLRRVMSDYPQLADTKLAVFYACSTGRRPGIASYDWVGCDDYDSGCGVLSGHVARLVNAMTSSQRLMLIAGGASPWRQDPACFEAYAHRERRVVALVGFIWQTVTDGSTFTGIRENGMRRLYCEAGQKITRPGAPVTCQ